VKELIGGIEKVKTSQVKRLARELLMSGTFPSPF
jgi:hypothetical protein